MEVTYTLSREDYWQFNLFVLKRRRRYIWGPVINGLLTGALMLLIVLKDEAFSAGPGLFALAVGCAAGGFHFVGRNYLVRREAKRLPAKDGSLLATNTVRIDEEGFQERSAIGEAKWKWSGIREILENQNYIYLFVDKHMAFIIPKGAFPDSDTARAFIDSARSHWQSARANKT